MIIGNNKVSIYKNIFDTTSDYVISIDDAINRIKNGKSREAVVALRNETNKDRQQKMKELLPCITFSGSFKVREDIYIKTHSNALNIDFDDIEEGFKEKILNWKYTYAAWDSPRGTGIKAVVKIADGKKHREHFRAIQKLFPNVDQKCINESRVCYESYDPDVFFNKDSLVFSDIIKHEVISEISVTDDIFEIYKKLTKWMDSTGRSFSVGNRNQYVFILASALCRYGIGKEEAVSMLQKDYSGGTDFSSKEVDRTIQSAYKKNKNSFGSVKFTNEKLYSKETKIEISSKVLEEGFVLSDVIYGSSVYEDAFKIYLHGYESAETTFIPQLDEYFKFKRGEITLLTGIGNYGKSHYFNQLQLIRSIKSGNKWAIFSPENNPASEYYHDMTEMLLGCQAAGNANKPSEEKYNKAYEFVSNHFYYVYPDSIIPSPAFIKTKFLELIMKEKVDGVIIDPFNQLANDYSSTGGRTDKYLETFISDCQRFAQQNNVFFLLVAHPHKLQKPKGEINYPCPDVFDIADGAMWNNKCDNILTYHRPNGQSDPSDPLCEHHSKKIRRQKVIGKRGSFQFTLDRKKRRFYFNGFSPLDGNPFDCSDTAIQPEQMRIGSSKEKPNEEDLNLPF